MIPHRNLFKLQGTTPHTALLGEEGDISNLCQYSWYQWCYYRENSALFPLDREVLGRVLGPARGEGNEMSQWILKANGQVVPSSSHRPLTVAELHSDVDVKKREFFDKLIEERWGTSINPAKNSIENDKKFEEYLDEHEDPRVIPDIEDAVDSTGRLINQQPMYDRLLNAEVLLHHEDDQVFAKVVRRELGPDGKTNGVYYKNPFLNTLMYDIEFSDGTIKEYGANIIAENMVAQADEDGFTSPLMKCIID